MPFTLNGVGTRYVGKQNLLVRSGSCGYCGRATRTESFDTREWFVVLFVPLVPLARYHILDQCPSCTRHTRLLASVWKDCQSEARLSAESLLRQHPGDPRTAIDAHRKLCAYQLDQDAAQLESALAGQFGGSAEVLVYLGQLAEAAGRNADSLHQYERAHRADPANPAAREGLALHAVQDGRPERALELLAPVLEAGTMQAAGAGCALASALVAGARFEEAQRVLRALLERFPALGNVKSFARDLARCEKALGQARTRLPVTRRANLTWIAGATVVALAITGVIVADVSAAKHIKLWVVASAPGRVQVEIPGARPLSFRQPGVQELELPAGEYHARVSGALQREVAFKLELSAWPRFLDDKVNVLDATGNSLLSLEHTVYSARPDQRGGGHSLLYGVDFRRLDDVDYAFEEFPATLMVDAGRARVQKTRVAFVDAPLENVVYALIGEKDAYTALGLASWGLDHQTQTDELLDAYVAAVHAAHGEKQAAVLLAPRLEQRPVNLALHRAWIELATDREKARGRYRALGEREPGEPAWPYLLACTSTRLSERRELLEHALLGEAPAEMWFALAETQAAAGEWEPALASLQHAAPETAAGQRDNLHLRFDALGALGRADELEHELASVFAESPCDAWLASRQFERLPAGTADAKLVQLLGEWQQRALKSCGIDDRTAVVCVHAWCALAQGDVATLARLDGATKDHSLRWLLATGLADQGRLNEARPFLEGKLRCELEPYDALALALVCRAGGDEAQGAAWEQRALPQLTSGVDGEVARLLSGTRVGVADEALDLALRPWRKSVVLALLSLADAHARGRLLELAARLQARPIFPRRVIEELAAKALPR